MMIAIPQLSDAQYRAKLSQWKLGAAVAAVGDIGDAIDSGLSYGEAFDCMATLRAHNERKAAKRKAGFVRQWESATIIQFEDLDYQWGQLLVLMIRGIV